MQTVRERPAARAQLADWQREGRCVALVPTMGNLHAGHLGLVEAARQRADRVVATIFVNPTQFVAGEDYDHYPRSEAADREQLEAAGTDLVFVPDVASMYPAGLEGHTEVRVPALDGVLCGEYRPGHFTGVATVVTKLLNMLRPDVALFGEKDYQQLLVIRRLVADLALDVDIEAVATRRERDGLAMSSRNAYLDADERARAPQLYQLLNGIAQAIAAGERDFARLEREALVALHDGGWRPQYVAVRDAADLSVPTAASTTLRVFGAAWLGRARLIDNVAVGAPSDD